jgi:hypothetical protein
MLLYFLRPGVAHAMELNNDARRRAVTMVQEAIAQYLRQDAKEAAARSVADQGKGSRAGADAPWPPPGHFRKKRQGTLPGFFESKAD